jgi:DNA repair exonuclease SbcCD nuclease subunit
LSGFPFTRRVKEDFHHLIHQTRFNDVNADIHYLCLHQTFEGAQVGPVDFTFRDGPDNIPGKWIPKKFKAVLSGHIHRAQQLTHSLDGRSLSVPVIYPGSIERTSFAERFEEKYYVMIKLFHNQGGISQVIEYHALPSRPMLKLKIPVEDRNLSELRWMIRDRLAIINPNAVVRIDLTGHNGEQIQTRLTAAGLRALAPHTMNVSMASPIRSKS